MNIISLLDLAVNRFPFCYPVDLTSTIFAALVLAAVAALAVGTTATIIRRKGRPVSISHYTFYNDEDFSSCSSSEDEDNEDDEEESETDGETSEPGREDIHSEMPEESNFWPEIGGAVVKAWDGLGLGFQRSTSYGSGSISLYDLSRSENIRSLLAEIPAAINFATSPSLLLSATTSTVRVWDARSNGEPPVAASELQALRRRKMVGVTGGLGGKVYVCDNAGEVSAVDLRSSRPPATVRTWLDADEYAVDNSGSVASWCRNAAKCLTLLPLSE